MYALNLMRIALELAKHNHVYEDIASKFFEHFLSIAEAMSCMVGDGSGLWDEEDQFFYDVLVLPDNAARAVAHPIHGGAHSACSRWRPWNRRCWTNCRDLRRRLEWFLRHRPDLAESGFALAIPGRGERRLLSLLRGHRMKKLLRRMLDESEFLSDYGVRAMSQ